MPGFVIHAGATVLCIHGGQAQPTAPNARVTVSAMPTTTLATPYLIAGCTFPAMVPGAPPCVTAQFITAATRVSSMGQPLLLVDSQALCVPNGTPVLILSAQPRVTAL